MCVCVCVEVWENKSKSHFDRSERIEKKIHRRRKKVKKKREKEREKTKEKRNVWDIDVCVFSFYFSWWWEEEKTKEDDVEENSKLLNIEVIGCFNILCGREREKENKRHTFELTFPHSHNLL